jgi:hypothetical protein
VRGGSGIGAVAEVGRNDRMALEEDGESIALVILVALGST